MNGIAVADMAILDALLEKYDRDIIILALSKNVDRPARGRRKDAEQNSAVVWAHLQFLQKHRVQQPKKKLQVDCDILEENLNRHLAGRRKQGASAFRKMHFVAQKHGRESSDFFLFMTGLLNQLEGLAVSPDVVLLPFLGEGTSGGLRTPLFDMHSIKRSGPLFQVGLWDDPRFSPVVTLVLDPTQKIFE